MKEIDYLEYDIYLLQLGFYPLTVGPTLVHNTTVIYIRGNNTDHRTHKIEKRTYKKLK